MRDYTLHFDVVALRFPHQKRGCLAVEGVGRIGIPKQLRQEDLKYVDHVEHGRPSLVDDVEADRSGPTKIPAVIFSYHVPSHPLYISSASGGCLQFVNVGVEDSVHEADARRLVGVLVGELDVDFPYATLERSYQTASCQRFCDPHS